MAFMTVAFYQSATTPDKFLAIPAGADPAALMDQYRRRQAAGNRICAEAVEAASRRAVEAYLPRSSCCPGSRSDLM